MIYHELLRDTIKKSGWSMREIARRCTGIGVNVSQPYLSKLCSGNISPASDKVNKVLGELLSKVTPIEKDDLLIAAYVKKIPADVITKIQNTKSA